VGDWATADRTAADRAEEDRAEEDRAEEDRAEEDRAEEDRAEEDRAEEDNTASALVARLRATLTAALGSGDRSAAAAMRSALAAVGNAEAIDPAARDGSAGPARAPGKHFAGAMAGLGAGEVVRKRLTATDVTQIVLGEIDERKSAAVEYNRLGHARQAERLRREADVLAAVLSPEHRDAQRAR
jgi:uncharacterized protein YqeY